MIDNKTIRKVIMLNKLQGGSPTYENREASGAVANFTTNTVQPFVKCECEILPIQEGTGTPSPYNPRPISGTSVLDIYHSGADTSDYDTTSVNLGQTVYGGSADVVGGAGSKTSGFAVYDGSEEWFEQSGTFRVPAPQDGYYDTGLTACIDKCNLFNPSISGNDTIRRGLANIVITTNSFSSLAEFKASLSTTPLQIAYPLATPTDFTFEGEEINSLLGVNNVWTDTGDTKVTYKYKTGEGGSSNKKYLPIFYDFYRKEKQS